MPVIIRKATISDLKTIQDLNTKLFHSEFSQGHDDILDLSWPSGAGVEYYQKSLTDPSKAAFIAFREGTPVGYVIGNAKLPHSWRKAVIGELENMLVEESERKKGVGRLLVDELKKWLKSQGTERLIVYSYSKNEKAIAFYRAIGFDHWDIGMEMKL